MTPPGPKELANRANAEATKTAKKRRLIPYAGKDRSINDSVDAFNYKGPKAKPKPPTRSYRKPPK